MPRKSGRSTYSEKIAERILDAVCEGKSLTEASAACDVPRQTVRSWLDRLPAFSSAFEAAKLVRVEALADQINILADSAQRVASDAVKAGENPNAAIAALRVQCENKRWLLAKLAPAQYGDRQTTELVGSGGKDLLQPSEASPSIIALAILNILNAGPGGLNDPDKPATDLPALPPRRQTLLSALSPPEPGPEPVPVRVEPPPATAAEAREELRWDRLTGKRFWVVE
jgi:hypothetical protein